MNKREAYEKCMNASLKNAEMWLKEATLLVEHGSRSHAHVLALFAVEEIGKAQLCWWTINKVYPFNHPLVDFRKRKKSIFGSHSLKGGMAYAFVSGFGVRIGKYTETVLVKHPETGEDVELRRMIHEAGRLMAKSRSYLMYVDIKDGPDGIEVINPLNENPQVEFAIADAYLTLATMNVYIKDTEKFTSKFKELRKRVAARDSFPEKPEWD